MSSTWHLWSLVIFFACLFLAAQLGSCQAVLRQTHSSFSSQPWGPCERIALPCFLPVERLCCLLEGVWGSLERPESFLCPDTASNMNNRHSEIWAPEDPPTEGHLSTRRFYFCYLFCFFKRIYLKTEWLWTRWQWQWFCLFFSLFFLIQTRILSYTHEKSDIQHIQNGMRTMIIVRWVSIVVICLPRKCWAGSAWVLLKWKRARFDQAIHSWSLLEYITELGS